MAYKQVVITSYLKPSEEVGLGRGGRAESVLFFLVLHAISQHGSQRPGKASEFQRSCRGAWAARGAGGGDKGAVVLGELLLRLQPAGSAGRVTSAPPLASLPRAVPCWCFLLCAGGRSEARSKAGPCGMEGLAVTWL